MSVLVVQAAGIKQFMRVEGGPHFLLQIQQAGIQLQPLAFIRGRESKRHNRRPRAAAV